MSDTELRKFVVTGYEAFQQRQFQEDGHVATTMYLRLNIRQDEGPPDRRTTLATIMFGPHDTHQIGQIAKRVSPHAGEFELDVTLPAADFDHYWNILTHVGQSHLRCRISPHQGVDIDEFTLASAKFPESGLP